MKKVVVVGAGFAGATISRKLADAGYKVDIYEKRDHIGGNAYDYLDKSNSYVHKYGPHIFHTNNDDVFDFLSKYTNWFKYEHKVLGYIDGQFVPIPFSLKSMEKLFSSEKAKELKEKLINKYGENTKVTISELKKNNNSDLSELADYVYNKVFLNYTKKQWELLPEQLGEGVTGRVPVYISYDEKYFQDKYQYMPTDGYTSLFEKMLDHENIKIHLNSDAIKMIEIKDDKIVFEGDHDSLVIFTGCIDELFDYKFGDLDYRSLKFDFENINEKSFQDAAVVNYPNDNDFTRITEFKKFTVEECESDNTTIVREYPCKYERGMIPYYPIPLKECEEKYKKYYDESKKINNLYLIGRLAEYKYYNMDLVIKSALDLAEKIITKEEE